jgi:hypothetical protein
MTYTKSALKNYKGSGVNPVGADQPFIYRDPPKAIFTRKKERVEMGDVQYMLRSDTPSGDPTRINEAINVYERGRNPMVQVDYGAGRGAKAPYKVEVVRPPLMPVETLNSISNPRIHQNYAVQSNPGNAPISLSGFIDRTDINRVNQVERNGGIIRSNPSVYTTSFQDMYKRENFKDSGALEDKLQFSTMSNVAISGGDNPMYKRENFKDSGALEDKVKFSSMSSVNVNGGQLIQGELDQTKIRDNLLKQLGTNFSSIVIYDPKNNTSIDVYANIKEKNYMAVTAAYGKPIIVNTPNGDEIILKDYTYSLVKPNIGNTQLVIQVQQPDVVLDRNTPLYSLSTNVKNEVGYNETLSRSTQEQFSLDKLANFGEYTDRVSKPFYHSNVEIPVSGCYKFKGRSKLIGLDQICNA